MFPELFRLPFLHLPVYGYGVMLVIGFLAATELGRFLARRGGLDPDFFSTAAILALVSGLAGARISHVLENWRLYTSPDRTAVQNLVAAVNISNGGLTFYGGFILATAVILVYAIRKGVPIRRSMDVVAPCLMVGLGFGRIGCFLFGCCFGSACPLPWAVSFPYGSPAYAADVYDGRVNPPPGLEQLDAQTGRAYLVERARADADPALAPLAARQRSTLIHPTQLYSTFGAWLLAGVCVAYWTLAPSPGRVFALMLLLEGPNRFLLELVRVEPPVVGDFSYSMVVAVIVTVAGVVLWFAFARPPRPATPAPAGPLDNDAARPNLSARRAFGAVG